MTANAAQSLSTYAHPTLESVDVRGKRVLVRVDYNIEQLADGSLRDDYRIQASLPTLKRLLQNGARVGVLTHWGRPGGRVVPQLSTKPLAALLSELLGQPVEHVPDCIGRVAQTAFDALPPGQILMLENTRFHLGEQLNQATFVQELAKLADVFVNDAYATAHRAHASTSGVAAAMPVSVVGNLMVQEMEWVQRVLNPMSKPFKLVLGGSDVEAKLDLLRSLLGHASTVMLGGAVANTFMAARDLGLGQSVLSPTHVDAARELLTEAGVVGCRLHLPQDVWVQDAADTTQPATLKQTHLIGRNETVVDIGSSTLETWQRLIQGPGTTVFVGSLGVTENAEGRRGSLGILRTLAAHSGFSLVGGAGMLALVQEGGFASTLPAVSTGGAALVDALCRKPLPCLQVLAGRA
ncbi:MAG: phosphoglycerate kinase [Blastochloris viridis]|uniref:Phosphoglycerate kinase n=1 Tax=Blastochloris viridis TaxID=1079 RepID=A0A6N4RED5_BLAVI|nr:MAG: phosphoglycerate kinase [Blastochloris viridis]